MTLSTSDYNVPTVSPSTPKVTDTLGTVFFSKGRTTETVQLLLAGLPEGRTRLTHRYSALTTEGEGGFDLYLWAGAIPEKKGAKKATVGEYVCWNPYRGASVQRAYQKTNGYVTKTRYGLSANDIAAYVVCSGEIDDQGTATQAQRIDALESEGGFRFTVVALSGDTRPESIRASGVNPSQVVPGKSIHCFVAIQPTTLDKWKRVQELICLTLGGDSSLSNPDRLMRLPGAIGQQFIHRGTGKGLQRLQTVLRTTPTLYEADALIAMLEAVVTARGLTLPATTSPTGGSTVRASRGAQPGRGATLIPRDFTEIPVEGTGLNLLEWAYQNLTPGSEVSIGYPFQARAKGDGVLEGSSCALRMSPNGSVWLHSFKTGENFRHSDSALPSGVTPVSSDPDEVVWSDDTAPTVARTAVQEEDYQEVQAAHRAGEKRARDISTLMAASPEFQAKVDKVAEAAKNLNPDIRDANIGVMSFAKSTLLPKFQALWASKGITRENSKPCGCRTGSFNALTYELVMHRRTCGALTCPNCGPLAASRKMAAILKEPMVSPKGDVTGSSLGSRPHTYVYTVPNDDLPAMIHMMQRAASTPEPRPTKTQIAEALGVTTKSLRLYVTGARKWPEGMVDTYEALTRPTGNSDYGDHGYVTFRDGSTTTKVLTSHNLLNVKHPVELVEQPNLESKVWELFTTTITITTTVTMEDLLTGEIETTPVEPTVTGGITSSHNLRLAPEAIAKIASGACFVQVVDVAKGMDETREVFAAIPEVATRMDSEGETLTASVTDIATLDTLRDRLSKDSTPYTPLERTLERLHKDNREAQSSVDFDALLDSTLDAMDAKLAA